MKQTIKSRFDVPANKMSDKNISDNLNSRFLKSIIDALSRDFCRKHHECPFDEVYAICKIGMWNAIKKYNQHRGKFTSYAKYICMHHMRDYFYRTLGSGYINSHLEVELPEDLSNNNNEENMNISIISAKYILDRVKPSNRKILIKIMTGELPTTNERTLSEAAKRMHTTTFLLQKKIQTAINEAQYFATV